jgi:endonuclease-3 related protein
MARLSLPWPSPLRRRLIRLYDTLATRYGPQGWWPARSAFEVIVGVILTQNAAWVNVEPVVARLRRAGALSPAGLEAGSVTRLSTLLRPLAQNVQ